MDVDALVMFIARASTAMILIQCISVSSNLSWIPRVAENLNSIAHFLFMVEHGLSQWTNDCDFDMACLWQLLLMLALTAPMLRPGDRLNIKDCLSRYRDSHYNDKTVFIMGIPILVSGVFVWRRPPGTICDIDIRHNPVFGPLTHWSLGDLDAILKTRFSILFYWLVSSDFLMIMPSNKCHWTLLMVSQHCFK